MATESHIYPDAGTYNVTQTVTNATGSATSEAKQVVVNSPAFDTPTFKTQASNVSNTGGTLTVTTPADVVEGDFLVIIIAQRDGDPIITAPSAWTFKGKAADATKVQSLHVYTRFAGATPPSPTFTSNSTAAMVAWVQVWRAGSVDSNNPLNTFTTDWFTNASLTNVVPALSTTSDKTVRMVFASQVFGATSPTFTASGTWTSDGQRATTAATGNIAVFSQHKTISPAGVSGSPTITSDANNVWAGITFAINPPGGLPPEGVPEPQVAAFRVRNGQWQRDGVDFVPVGFVMMAVSQPIDSTDTTSPGIEAWDNWVNNRVPMMTALRNNWHVNTFRLQLGQNGVDPQGRNYSQAYIDRIRDVVSELRDNGFFVILCMQDQEPVDGDLHSLPTAHTQRAWQKILPYINAWDFEKRSGVACEIFNEPKLVTARKEIVTPTVNDWDQWRNGGHPTGTITQAENNGDLAIGHQQLLQTIRNTGFKGIVIAAGQDLGHTLSGMPVLTDTLSPQNVGYSIHTQQFHIADNSAIQDRDQIWAPKWNQPKNDLGIAVTSTEWSTRRVADRAGVKAVVPELLDYLKARGIGIQPWAIDADTTGNHAYVISKTGPNAWVPNDWDAWDPVDNLPGTGAGELLYARYPTWDDVDTAPSGPPTVGTLSNTGKTPSSVTLSWTAASAPVADPVTSYKIYRGGVTAAVATLSATARTHTITGLSANTTYTFQHTAVNTAGESTRSNTVTVTTDDTVSPPTGKVKFGGSAISGGGFQNVIAISPNLDSQARRPFIVGGDVAGIHYTLDGGREWSPAYMEGQRTHVAALAWHPVTPGKCYAMTNEGFWVSTDWGKNWNKSANSPGNADANGTYQPYGNEHPRPTGNLIAVSGTNVWVLTQSQGVRRSNNDGDSWTAAALNGNHGRGMAVDPNNANTLWVAIYNGSGNGSNGIWKSTNATGTLTFTKDAGYNPGESEEVFALDDAGTTRVYVAAGRSGIYRYQSGAWSNITNGLNTSNKWASVTAFKDGGNIHVYAGCVEQIASKQEVARSTDNGASWSYITTDANATVSNTVFGGQAGTWIFSGTSGYHTLANTSHAAAALVSNPDERDRIYFAGRGGVWTGKRNATTGDTLWQPAAFGLAVTVNNQVMSDPNNPGVVGVNNMDYSFFVSDDHLASAVLKIPGFSRGTGNQMYWNAHDTSGVSTVITGTSERNASGTGQCGFSNDIVNGGWTDLNAPHHGQPGASCVMNDASGNIVYMITFAGAGQLYRKVGSGGWNTVLGTSQWGWFCTRKGTDVVFYISGNGLFRSNNAGADWVKIRGETHPGYNNMEIMSWDPIDDDILYIRNSSSNIIRVSGVKAATATGGTTASTVLSGGVRHVGVDGQGNVYANQNRKLMKSTNPRSSSPSWVDVGDFTFSTIAGNCRSMHVSKDGYVYLASNGQGVIRGVPQ